MQDCGSLMAWGALFRVCFALTGVFLVLPRILFKRPRDSSGPADRFAIDLIRVSAFLIVVTHVLVPIRLFQMVGLMIAFGFWVCFFRLGSPKQAMARLIAFCEKAADMSLWLVEAGGRDGNLRVKEIVRGWRKDHLSPAVRRIIFPHPKALAAGVFVSAPLTFVLVGSFLVRAIYPLQHAALLAPDAYVHLAWIKYLLMGHLYHDGLYPLGMHSILGVAERLSPASIREMLRFAGPFMSTILVFLVYVIGLRATNNGAAATASAAVLGFTSFRANISGVDPTRQTAMLPQEFAVVIALAGVLMLIDHVARPSRSRLIYFGMAAFVVSMTHTLVGITLVMVAIPAGIVMFVRTKRVMSAVAVWTCGAVGTILGNLYLLPGFLPLGPLHLFGGVHKFNPIKTGTEGFTYPLPGILQYPLAILAVAGAVIGLLAGIIRWSRGDRRGASAILLGLFVIAGVAGLVPHVLDQWYWFRLSQIVFLILPLGIALGIGPVRWLWERRPPAVRIGIVATLSMAIVGGLIVELPPVVASPIGVRMQYDSAAHYYDSVIRQLPRLNYTVVGTPEWYSIVLGSGYHLDLRAIDHGLTTADARDPGFVIPIPTRYVYVVTEKRPLEFTASLSIKRSELAAYYSPEQRMKLMHEADDWMRTYAEFHDDARISYEDRNLRVWKVDRAPEVSYSRRYKLSRFAS